ncbi:N-acetylmuramoyl-L-alanine amidase [Paenibacillus xylanexedens]|uniref:N-acetylmuramoyl-L-alanine amidase n=1 Tax=Paenibacillus xylanexedens TaxID=528191 RepID=UPI0011A13B76|nr:N-acetylmuramoyl-L-alanine amidase [Paenibacillus xylanexedens]
MYDFIVDLIHTLFKNGLTLSSLGAVVFLILKQRKMKAQLRKFLPWMFQDDNEIKAYMANQIVIMRNQEIIMRGMGLEPWSANILNEKPPESVSNLNRYYLSSWAITTYAQLVNKYTIRRYLKMAKKRIVIDAGHGAQDPGAIGPTGKREKDFNLTMALKLDALLKGNENLQVSLTRRTDVFLELRQRVKIANEQPADLFISIHANSATAATASGTETFYNRTTSAPLAGVIQRHMQAATGFKDRGARYGNFAVIRDTKMDAVLLEVGFISNPEEEKKLFDNDFQDRVALAVAKGICEYLGVPFETEKPAVQAPYPEMTVTVHTDAGSTYTGYNIKGITWVPSRPIGELLGGRIGYVKSKVTINGEPVETQNINGVGYVTARDLTKLLGARIFWDKAEPSKVEIYH